MRNYLLTIAIPTYNREKYVRRLLKTITPELNDEVEVLVSDNASTDNTDSMISLEFPNVTYYRNSVNMGADRNFLECYKKAGGEYVWLVGSDDIVIEGAIERILTYIKKNSSRMCPLIFLNHASFYGEYNGMNNCGKAFLNIQKKDEILLTKQELIKYTGRQLTFMSAFLLRNDSVKGIAKKERYIGTNFIQTYFAFDVSKGEREFGIIFYPCVAQDMTPNNSSLYQDFAKMFKIFGSDMYNVYVIHACEDGFDYNQMRDVFIKGMRRIYVSWILRSKASNNEEGVKTFWKDVYPVLKKYPLSWITVFPVAAMPPQVIKAYYALKKWSGSDE